MEGKMTGKYVLDGHEPILEGDLLAWGKWMQDGDRIVAQTMVGEVRVSTIFLGLDYNFHLSGPPLLFETMVFGGELDQEQERYSNWDEAVAGHEAMVARIK
jgi:hypothetical protein